MKKRLALLLGGLLLVAALLTGCGSESTVESIQKRGVLSVGVKNDVPKFGYENISTNEIEGFEIDIAKAIAKKILGDDSKISFTSVTAKTRGPLLDNGDVDMLVSTFTITEERKKSYNFTEPYFTDGVGLLVRKDEGINSLADLDGKTIGVAQTATSKAAIEEEAAKIGITVKFAEFASYPELKTALDSKRVDCFSVDRAILFGYLDDSTVILPDRFSPQEYGIATKLSNEALAEFLNTEIQAMKASGELQNLLDKWGIE